MMRYIRRRVLVPLRPVKYLQRVGNASRSRDSMSGGQDLIMECLLRLRPQLLVYSVFHLCLAIRQARRARRRRLACSDLLSRLVLRKRS